MAVSYPDAIGEHIGTPERFETGGLQYVGYLDPAEIAPEQVSNLYLFLQNMLSVPLKANFKINAPQSGGLFRSGKALLMVETEQFELELAAGEAGLLTVPVTTTDHTEDGLHSLTLETKVSAQKGGKRVRPSKTTSKLDDALIESPVGLNLVSSLGATYVENSVKKAPFPLKVAGEPAPPERAPQMKHSYESIWTEDDVKFFNQAVKELNLREVKLKDELGMEALYATLFSETAVRFADAGLPLRIGEAIILAKILTYSCQYFLSSPKRRNGLLVPIWEHALAAQADTSHGLDIIRGVGYHHVLRLSIAVSFGLIAQAVGSHAWPLAERQAVTEHIADSIEMGQPLDVEFLYLPLLMAGTYIARKFKLKGEDVGHTLALAKQAKDARPSLFLDQDMEQANKIYSHLLKKALQ